MPGTAHAGLRNPRPERLRVLFHEPHRRSHRHTPPLDYIMGRSVRLEISDEPGAQTILRARGILRISIQVTHSNEKNISRKGAESAEQEEGTQIYANHHESFISEDQRR